jgi:hypothetical protein
MVSGNKVSKGTIYIQGAPSRFQPVIDRALDLGPADGELSFDLSIDVIRSVLSGEPVYRVDYTLEKEGKQAPAAQAGGLFTWFYSLFFS